MTDETAPDAAGRSAMYGHADDTIGETNRPPTTDEWLTLLQYANARAHGHVHGHVHGLAGGNDPWPEHQRLRSHRIRRDAPDRDWQTRPDTAAGHTRFDCEGRHLHCGFGWTATRTVNRETTYLETHASPYLPEITAHGHGWLETRIPSGEPADRPGPWLHSLARMLREMHETPGDKPQTSAFSLMRLERVCGREPADRARKLLVPGRRRPQVTTHGNLHPGTIFTRNGRHLTTVTGFDSVRAASPERDTVSLLTGIAPIVGLETLGRSMHPAADPRFLRDELLRTLDRLAGRVDGHDRDALARRVTVKTLTGHLLERPEIADEIAERLN